MSPLQRKSVGERLRSAADALTPDARERVERVARHLVSRWPRPRWGNLRRSTPIGDRRPSSSRTPVDAFYFEQFIDQHRDTLHGRVLQLGSRCWSAPWQDAVIESVTVVDLDPNSTEASIIADPSDPFVLQERQFDCEIVPALSVLRSPRRALENLWRALRPGGVLLVAAPGMGRVGAHTQIDDDGRWRWSASSFRELLTETLPQAEVTLETFGSVASVIASVHGLTAEEVGSKALSWRDRRFPVIVCARVQQREGSVGGRS